ncbi:hypothetical protein M5D96_007782 [Drosophila gunungcola]|uniref:Uncharacterized protein n=1 Tax=Drosophila gunungcola TaxID=103775 RepID=A0A9Q0BNT9_9MUSC|nr:hypothetical protein M5D96_007782 [Drosophila gunungcola]
MGQSSNCGTVKMILNHRTCHCGTLRNCNETNCRWRALSPCHTNNPAAIQFKHRHNLGNWPEKAGGVRKGKQEGKQGASCLLHMMGK